MLACLYRFALLLALWHAPAALAAERILSFDSDIVVHRDGAMTVTESIQVRSEQQQIKRGIYRDFPTRYETPYGTVSVGFEVLMIERDGRLEPYHTEQRSNGVRVYIGDKNRILPPGQYRYTIRYRTDRQLGFFDDHDELYWNVTGNGWEFPIDNATARVTLPAGLSVDPDSLEAYTGYQGDKGRDYHADVNADGTVVFETTRGLRPREGLTIVVAWPPGIIERPTTTQRLAYLLRDNAGPLVGLGGLVLVFIYYLLSWRRVGRDPEAGVVMPRFEPPRGLSPGAVRYIRRMGHDARAFAAAVVNLAVKGHIVIENDDGEYTVSRAESGNEGRLYGAERVILKHLLGGVDRIVLKQANHRSIRAAMQSQKRWLRNKYHEVYFKTNGWLLLPGIALSVIVVLGAGFGSSDQPFELLMLSAWLAGWTFTVFMLFRQGRKGMAAIFTLFELGAIAAFIGLGSYWLLTVVAGLIAVNIVFYYLIKAPTDAGRDVLDEIEGLKMYMELAEKDRLNMLNPPELTPRHFETLMPYALALDIDQKWSERFAAHLARHGEEPDSYRPAWYHGRGAGRLNTAGLSSSLGASLSGAISSASTAPGSSSGGGGGGSSGGGGGGGGGGGW